MQQQINAASEQVNQGNTHQNNTQISRKTSQKSPYTTREGKLGPIQAKQRPVNKSQPESRTIDPFKVVPNAALEAHHQNMEASYAQAIPIQRQQEKNNKIQPQGSAKFKEIATAMGEQHGVDTSLLKATHNSSFPATVNAAATIQGNKIDFAPGQDSEPTMKHEVAHYIDNAKNGVPSGDKVVNGQKVDTTREQVVDRMAEGTLQRKDDVVEKNVGATSENKVVQRVLHYIMNPVYLKLMQKPVYRKLMLNPAYRKLMLNPAYRKFMLNPVYLKFMLNPVYLKFMLNPMHLKFMLNPVYLNVNNPNITEKEQQGVEPEQPGNYTNHIEPTLEQQNNLYVGESGSQDLPNLNEENRISTENSFKLSVKEQSPVPAIENTEKSKLTWPEVKLSLERGNNFNAKARKEQWYDYNEIHLANGKRLDSYDPDLGEIVSRKATDFNKIKLSTLLSYAKEFDNKYAPGTEIRSNKYPDIDGQKLKGKKILEVPVSNQISHNLKEFQEKLESFNIELRFRDE